MIVIMHKGAVYMGIYFNSTNRARNYIKMKFPKRTFGEPEMNKLVCKQYGTIFKIQELKFNED